MIRKTFDIEVKEVGEGKIEGWANVYSINGQPVIDRQGDVIEKGALAEAKRLPILVNHDMNKAVGVGYAYEREQDGKYGIWVSLALAIDSASNTLRERAMEVYEMAKKGILNSFSIGFIAKETTADTVKNRRVRKILSLDLVETSLVIVPANQESLMATVKSAGELYYQDDVVRAYTQGNEVIDNEGNVTRNDLEEAIIEMRYNPRSSLHMQTIEKRCVEVLGDRRFNFKFILHDEPSRKAFNMALDEIGYRFPYVEAYLKNLITYAGTGTSGLKPIH